MASCGKPFFRVFTMALFIGLLVICIPLAFAYVKYKDTQKKYDKRMAEIQKRLHDINEDKE